MSLGNIIVNIDGAEWQTKALEARMISQGVKKEDIKIINLKASDIIDKTDLSKSTIADLKKLTSSSKVYVIGHCCTKSASLGNVHYTQLADYFGQAIKQDENPDLPSLSGITFSLIACYAGTGDDTDPSNLNPQLESFGGRFHRYLGNRYQIPARVMCRTQISMVHVFTHAVGKKTATYERYDSLNDMAKQDGRNFSQVMSNPLYLHQQPGTKITFNWNQEGRRIINDSYKEKFVERTKKFLKREEIRTNGSVNLKAKEFLDKLEKLELIEDKTVAEVKNFLLELKADLRSDEKNKKPVGFIDEILNFSTRSISDRSAQSKLLETSLDDPFDSEGDIDDMIKKRIHGPSLNGLRTLFPKNSDVADETLKAELISFKDITKQLQKIGGLLKDRKLKDFDVSTEQKLARLISLAIETAGSKTLTQEEKIVILKEIQNDFKKIRPSDSKIARYKDSGEEILDYQKNYLQSLQGLCDDLDAWCLFCSSPKILEIASA